MFVSSVKVAPSSTQTRTAASKQSWMAYLREKQADQEQDRRLNRPTPVEALRRSHQSYYLERRSFL